MPLNNGEIYCAICLQKMFCEKMGVKVKFEGQFGFHYGDLYKCSGGHEILAKFGAEIIPEQKEYFVDYVIPI